MIPFAYGVRNTFQIAPFTVTGLTVSKLTPSGNRRSGIELHNPDSTYTLYVKGVQRGLSAPTLTVSDKHYQITPGSTIVLPWSEAIDVYVTNSSGASTSSYVNAAEVQF